MKIENRKIKLYEINDFVRTPDGVGKVYSVNENTTQDGYFIEQEITVQHKFNCSANTENRPVELDYLCVSEITEQEYNNECD